MLVVGIDPSVKSTGLVVMDDEENLLYATSCELPHVGLVLESIKDKYDIDVVGIENPGWYARAIVSQSAKNSLIRMLRKLFGRIPIYQASPRTWRRRVLGNGSAKKEDAMAFAKRMGWEAAADNHNIAEALCVALYALKEHKIHELQRKAIRH